MVFMMLLTACAKDKDGAAPEAPAGSCAWIPGPRQIKYDDGVIRKSDYYECTQSDGTRCFLATYVNDASVRVTSCTEHLN